MNDNSIINWHSMSDEALLVQIGKYVKHHRLQKNRTQDHLSSEAGISRSTLSLLEKGQTVTLGTLVRVLRVLDLLYVMEAFRIEHVISPMLLAEAEMKYRKRARNKKGNETPPSDW